MKKVVFFLIILYLFPMVIDAKSGCCSHHGGVAGCNSSGRQVCNDGTLSPSCRCTPSYVYGCTDRNAKNYNSKATKDDGSCSYYVYGCMDKTAKNYNSKAEKDDGNCIYYVYGCMDKTAKNYNPKAEKDDNSCVSYVYGCTDVESINYNSEAEKDDGSCVKKIYGCMDKTAKNYNANANVDDNNCEYEINSSITGMLILYFLIFFGVTGYLVIKDLRKRI